MKKKKCHPPAVLGLTWNRYSGSEYRASETTGFTKHAGQLPSCMRYDGYYNIYIDTSLDCPELADWVARMATITAAMEAEQRAKWQAIFDRMGKSYAASAEEVRREGQRMLEHWGAALTRKAYFAELVETVLLPPRLDELKKLIAVNKAEIKSKAIEARTVEGGVDWSDADVVAALTLLTYEDADRAKLSNDRGWNVRDSSTGHWCYGMLRVDRDLAIRVARTIVGNYPKQFQPSKKVA